MSQVQAFAALSAGESLQAHSYQLGQIGAEEVTIKVEYCGICHSDLSMLNNDWGMSQYPLIPGHEVIGVVSEVGESVKGVKVGERVGLGWLASSCMHCNPCMDGAHNLCASQVGTITGRHGGFADTVRCHWAWAIPIPKELDPAKAGPLLCGGITVFNPIVQMGVKPTDKVAVIGIGGLGHLALQFLNKWGCEVTAFSSSPDKAEELKALGAHRVLNSRDSEAMAQHNGSYDFILNTTNVSLDWNAYLDLLAAKGKLHTVGAVLEPMAIPAFSLLSGQKSVSGSPLGSPALTKTMLEFCARHQISPMTEEFALPDVNQAIDHLKAGKARYRVVLKV
ncbi:NAD(P)-dependent alcohol dehydrogenase [Kangiella sp. TOML190]|uniref:NADPH-dependent aldehyde reductase Ahr n=1 Tax=Kangiella sp. TOML190 TaxID=2931351 RepID=UPI00203A8C90|nr:NAD(P)-dependent alcohol dehydrogenase [Kangiella sp. TOML190]